MMSNDFLKSHENLERRVRALRTGAHPTIVTQGGYGRNTRWAKMAVRAPAVYDSGSRAWRRVRADSVHFKTDGNGIDISSVTTFPFILAQLGRSGWPATDKRFLCFRTGLAIVHMLVRPNGYVLIENNPGGSGFLILEGAFPLG